MTFLKIVLFHILCCLTSAVVVVLNFTLSSHGNVEFVLYAIYSLFMVIGYFIFGRKLAEHDHAPLKTSLQIWLLSILLCVSLLIDTAVASLLNLPFQLLLTLFPRALPETLGFVLVSFLPSILIQSGYFLCHK